MKNRHNHNHISSLTILFFSLAFSLSLIPSPASATTISGSPIVTATSSCTTGLSCGLVGYWTFDGKDTVWTNSTTATTLDKSGNGNTGTLTNMNRSTALAVGKTGQALNFSTSTYMTTSFYFTSMPLTFCAWIKPSLTGSNITHYIYSQSYLQLTVPESGGSMNWSMYYNNGSAGGGGNHNLSTSAGSITPNVWQYVCLTGSISGATTDLTLYINGSIAAGPTNFSSTALSHAGTSIGGNSSNPSLIGVLDDIRIYNRALSAAEIKQLYNAGR